YTLPLHDALPILATPESEEFLLMIALHGTASHVERAVRQFRRAKRSESLEAENDRHERRRLVWHMDEDGCWVMHGRFTPEQGERIMKAVDAAMDEIAEEQKDVTAETSAEPAMDKPMPCPVEQRRADAFERLAEGFLSGDGGAAHGGDRCTLHVHTDVDTLRADGQGAESTLASGGRVSAETSRRLACDCGVVPWRESGDGETLDVGRKTRSIPPAIRRALQRRDDGCRFPGCTAQHHVDAHHVRHWA